MAGFFEQQEVCSLYACLLIGNFRIVHVYVSQTSREKRRCPWRARESARWSNQDLPLRISGLSAGGPCSRAEPDIYLQPRAPRSLRRRSSVCSLPVPKQFVVSLWSLSSFAQWT